MESLVQFTGSYFSKFGMWQPSGEINKTQCNGSRRGGEGEGTLQSPLKKMQTTCHPLTLQ